MSDSSNDQKPRESGSAASVYAARARRKAVENLLNALRRQLIQKMWYPGDGKKTDIGTVTACVEGVNQFFDDKIRELCPVVD